MNYAFTIVAKNYIGLANVLAHSLLSHNNDVMFYVFIADEIDDLPVSNNPNITYLQSKNVLNYEQQVWDDLSFKYNLTEFCTAIKPAAFKYIIDNSQLDDHIIYFDPDIFVFNALDGIYADLKENFVVLTPHVTTIEPKFTGTGKETNHLGSGIYNLGFLAIKNCVQSEALINWWHNRLLNSCYVDKFDHLFTDQKWIDFIHSFFDTGVFVSRDLGRNMAPWNFYERKIYKEGGEFFCTNRIDSTRTTKLIFVHFSGYNYLNLSDKINKDIPNIDFNVYNDLNQIFDAYNDALQSSDLKKYLSLKYSYNSFDDGQPIVQFQRRLYRRLVEDNVTIAQPFSTTIANGFYSKLKKQKLLASIDESNIDKITNKNYSEFDKKIAIINRLMIILFNVIGFKRYTLFAKLLTNYFRVENQIFLYDRSYLRSSFKK